MSVISKYFVPLNNFLATTATSLYVGCFFNFSPPIISIIISSTILYLSHEIIKNELHETMLIGVFMFGWVIWQMKSLMVEKEEIEG